MVLSCSVLDDMNWHCERAALILPAWQAVMTLEDKRVRCCSSTGRDSCFMPQPITEPCFAAADVAATVMALMKRSRSRSKGRCMAGGPPDDALYVLRWARLCHCCLHDVDNQDDYVRPLGPNHPTVILVRDEPAPCYHIFAVRFVCS